MLQIENPNVSHQEVSNLFHKRIAGSLTYEEWIYMVEDIYPRPEDQQAVLAQMMECIEVNRDARRAEEEAKAREETKSGRRSATLKGPCLVPGWLAGWMEGWDGWEGGKGWGLFCFFFFYGANNV